ncbi:3-ketoacyl-(acyl-carrier-protein) reductase [Planococcus antarcticus DSM 14505]|uniref:3-ketoacyl-(Acyl-carrier-protein) reductase n=1 Tax=Planococcus antarcticus DSM 14505 TaxID=1185653 RepID=A0AA87IMT4_9BACL|nr:SDR family oxidoreductase [Planococcus antarcticus]EIM07012.1 3-ketoacyl-(acyl-carrier-protein) reductase [Planococcus antarcticus DSM 14505]
MSEQQKCVAIVTGVGNPKGIGAAVCRKLATRGVDIFFTHWESSSDFPDKFKLEIIDMGVQCEFIEVDLSKKGAYKTVFSEVSEKLGPPNILINNAAYSTDSNYMELTEKLLDDHYYVNVRTTSLLCTEFARQFQKSDSKYGRIINLTSGQSLGPMPGELAYAATKGAISAFTVSLSSELAELGITVNAVNPGPTDTTWMTDDIRLHLLPKFKAGRIGKAEDAANIIAFLASEEAGWITGQIINSEGGFLRG